MSKTIEMIKGYIPYNKQEECDKNLFISSEETFKNILTRDNTICHLTSASFVINKEKTKVLSIYHNLFDAWSIPGGHADGEDDMLNVAKKELQEETSLKNFKCLLDSPISIDALAIHSHFKKGKFISSHIHLNTTYLFEGDENDSIHLNEDENSGVCWLTFDELLEKSTEPHMIPFYRKIIERIKSIN